MNLHRFNHERPDFAPYGFTCELWEPTPMNRSDRHNEIELNLLKRGSLTYFLGASRVAVRQKILSAFWGGIPHRMLSWRGHPEYYVITIPLAWFLQCRLPSKLVVPVLHGRCIFDSDTRSYDLDIQMFQRWENDLKGNQNQPPQAMLLELHARMLRLAEGIPDEQVQDSRSILGAGSINKIEQMAAFIAQHYQEQISIEDVAHEVQLHPNYAMNLFKKSFRVTMNEYLTQNRIAHAQRLLAITDKKIIDVAFDAGFRTLSRFYDAFGKACDCTPSQYRQNHQIGA